MEELAQKQEWLKSNRGPPQKVFDVLNDTHDFRKTSIKNATAFGGIVSAWPRLFDMPGAVCIYEINLCDYLNSSPVLFSTDPK